MTKTTRLQAVTVVCDDDLKKIPKENIIEKDRIKPVLDIAPNTFESMTPCKEVDCTKDAKWRVKAILRV